MRLGWHRLGQHNGAEGISPHGLTRLPCDSGASTHLPVKLHRDEVGQHTEPSVVKSHLPAVDALIVEKIAASCYSCVGREGP
eukprot:COSAG02_NODE_5577_length_4217_cov_2.366926_3_plen_82_part_00